VHTRATENVMPDIPEGFTGRGRGRGQAPHGNPLPLLHHVHLSAFAVAGNPKRAHEFVPVE
jgi:hypothetical protein